MIPQTSHTIPLNRQDAKAIGGLEVNYLSYEEIIKHSNAYSHTLNSHRDDYYILMIILKGRGIFKCDMEEIELKANSIVVVRPYQVHAAKEISDNAEAYFISVAPFLMPDHCSSTFRDLPVSQQRVKIPAAEKKSLVDTVLLLCRAFAEDNTYKTFIIQSLFNAVVNRAAAMFAEAGKESVTPNNQSALITQKFRQLVSDHSFAHPPSFFSEKLNITTSHLNDCIKSRTGMSVTAYLQEAMLLEAKRNLYYTNDDVKTIAFRLGFEDHTYFSRLFKKIAGETPLSFRNKFRE